ncbi:MAG TPA: hypothetical protein EYG38_02185, partial [Verrucomicrobia bacterium]|nr:hypothetical protein [Verrucomicrobiota bacterium]
MHIWLIKMNELKGTTGYAMRTLFLLNKLILIFLFGFSMRVAGEIKEITPGNSRYYRHTKLGITLVKSEWELEGEGLWSIAEVNPPNAFPVQDMFLKPISRESSSPVQGRLGRAQIQLQSDRDRNLLRRLYWYCSEFALAHNDSGPESLESLIGIRNFDIKWYDGRRIFLIPETEFAIDKKTKRVPPKNAVPLAFELDPLQTDGKHWVLDSAGRIQRKEIDLALMQTLKIEVVSRMPEYQKIFNREVSSRYELYARLSQRPLHPVRIRLIHSMTQEERTLVWNLDQMDPGETLILERWLYWRGKRWASYYGRRDSSDVLYYWARNGAALYDTQGSVSKSNRPVRRRTPSANLLNVLGGRTAMRETFQMQELVKREEAAFNDKSVKLSEIERVSVKSHPFEKMLGSREGGRISMADLVPEDRFFCYFAKPASIVPFMKEGMHFVHDLSAMSQPNRIGYDLKKRYLKRLGVTEQWVESLLKSGIVRELGLVLPDLFFIDGAEVTVMMKLSHFALVNPFLKILGISVDEGRTSVLEGSLGNTYIRTLDDHLILSTSRQELDRVLSMKRNNGVNSLGRSAEFRYMLEKLPPGELTRAYLYFSDAFIRRLVGPELKIAQLRRLTTRSDLEIVTAAALLYRADTGRGEAPDLPKLVSLGYLSHRFLNSNLQLNSDYVAVSSGYGRLTDFMPLSEFSVEGATHAEADAYNNYRRNYTRFWSRFFDPIAVRLDDTEDGGLEMSTFILPLLDASIYNRIRTWIRTAEEPVPLKIPKLKEDPVLMMSVNLSEETWLRMIRDLLSSGLERYTGIPGKVFDYLGPGIHFVVDDA